MGRRNFSEEFKTDAVRRVRTGGFSVPKLSQALGVGQTALRRWVDEVQARESAPAVQPGDLDQAQRRIAELQKQVAQLEQEKALLKKSVAFFVKEIER
jgi:transposase